MPTPWAELYEEEPVPEHLVWTWWWFAVDKIARNVIFTFTIHNDPAHFSDQHGLYLIVCQSSISGHTFYFGLQTNAADQNQWVNRGKAVIFSRWGERDLDFARTNDDDDGSWYESSGHEGDFIGVRREYDWGPGTYQMRIAADGLDEDGEWYSLWITETSTAEEFWVGSLKFPLEVDQGETTLVPPLYSALEVYGLDPIRPIDIPEWYVTLPSPKVHGLGAIGAKHGYGGVGNADVHNADVWCDEEEEACHLRIGGLTRRVTPPGVAWFY